MPLSFAVSWSFCLLPHDTSHPGGATSPITAIVSDGSSVGRTLRSDRQVTMRPLRPRSTGSRHTRAVAEWVRAGTPISDSPWIRATFFFRHSYPSSSRRFATIPYSRIGGKHVPYVLPRDPRLRRLFLPCAEEPSRPSPESFENPRRADRFAVTGWSRQRHGMIFGRLRGGRRAGPRRSGGVGRMGIPAGSETNPPRSASVILGAANHELVLVRVGELCMNPPRLTGPLRPSSRVLLSRERLFFAGFPRPSR